MRVHVFKQICWHKSGHMSVSPTVYMINDKDAANKDRCMLALYTYSPIRNIIERLKDKCLISSVLGVKCCAPSLNN